MRTPNQILEFFLDAVLYISGANSTCLFVPDPRGVGQRTLLLHRGEKQNIPELATIEAAKHFSSAQPNQLNGERAHKLFSGSFKSITTTIYQSQNENAILLPLLENQAESPAMKTCAWLGIHSANNSTPKTIPEARDMNPWQWVLSFGETMTRDIMRVSGILNDPVSGLPGRAEFFELLEKELRKVYEDNQPISVLCISPDNFGAINELRGLDVGDVVIKQISSSLQKTLASNHILARYGGVVFAALLKNATQEETEKQGRELLNILHNQPFYNGEIRLRFSCGATTIQNSIAVTAAGDFVDRALHALNGAKREGGSKLLSWQPNPNDASTTTGDALAGVFTGTMGKDYRNMVLLWETVELMAQSSDIDELSQKVIKCMRNAFRADRMAIMTYDHQTSEITLLAGYHNDAAKTHITTDLEELALDANEEATIRQSVLKQTPIGDSKLGAQPSEVELTRPCLTIPLITRNRAVGVIYLDRLRQELMLDPTDLDFLKIFASQIAVALDRGTLAREELARKEHKRLKLLGEVHELRQALGHAKMVYNSPQMDSVLQILRQVAPTDATLLLTGESGTGKGVLARTVHKLSRRADKPLVLVDCSSITPSLIESELFGHERGAFTGAQRRSIGRLLEADGGTLFMDEVGELPLEVQGKLLTFVQDKQLMAVGSSKTKSVDVRIIAATNRDLAAEVDAGRFRRDLYYRLNVVSVEIPPLRQRPDDIMLLARYFIERFNLQYQKAIRGLSPTAEKELLKHPWPGNIRELQNRIMRSVILASSDQLSAQELGFDTPGLDQKDPPPLSRASSEQSPSEGNQWKLLGQKLEGLVQQIDARAAHQSPPLGKWLEEDLIEAAYEEVGGIHRRGAALLGIPETTFRRKMKQIYARTAIGGAVRTPEWQEIKDIVPRLVQLKNPTTEDWVVKSRNILLRQVVHRFGDRTSVIASLMGVTEPTILRWRQKLD